MNENERKKEEKRGIFLGIIGVLTLIVAIIGASFAYFSVNARSGEDAVTARAASVQIVYDDGQEIVINNLIPANDLIALESQRRFLAGEDNAGVPYEMCKDDNRYTICGIYEFTLTNNGNQAVDVTAWIDPKELQGEVLDPENPENNRAAEKGFKNLKFKLFDITEVTSDTPVESKNGELIHTGNFGYEDFGILDDDIDETMSIPGNGAVKKYRLFVWLNEAGEDNNQEQGAVFKGTVHIDLPGASNITGDTSSSGQ